MVTRRKSTTDRTTRDGGMIHVIRWLDRQPRNYMDLINLQIEMENQSREARNNFWRGAYDTLLDEMSRRESAMYMEVAR